MGLWCLTPPESFQNTWKPSNSSAHLSSLPPPDASMVYGFSAFRKIKFTRGVASVKSISRSPGPKVKLPPWSEGLCKGRQKCPWLVIPRADDRAQKGGRGGCTSLTMSCSECNFSPQHGPPSAVCKIARPNPNFPLKSGWIEIG